MQKKLCYFIVLLLLAVFSNAGAVSETDITFLQGKDVIYSSPFEDGSKAIKLKVDDVKLSTDFDDDGQLVINQKAYPIDQIFVQKEEGKYENLAYLLNYNGIASTYFIRYYDKERLRVDDEIVHLKQRAKDCVGVYNGGGSDSVGREAAQYGKCLDDVFYRVVDLFYTQSKERMLKNYEEQSSLWKRTYFDMIGMDYCYGRCGTTEQMQAYGRIVEAKQKFILDLLDMLGQQS